jgi:hypothetical protein
MQRATDFWAYGIGMVGTIALLVMVSGCEKYSAAGGNNNLLPSCGDGVVEGGEACDDGELNSVHKRDHA